MTSAPSPARVLFVSEAVTLAHLVRPLALAQALAEAGHEVHFAAAYRYESLLKEKSGLVYWPIESVSYQAFLSSVSGERSAYDDVQVESYIAEEEALIRDVRPDLIVGDARLTLAVSAPAKGVPWVNLNNAYWSPHRADRYSPVPDYKRSAFYRMFPVRLAEVLVPFPAVRVLYLAMKPWYKRRFLAPFNRARRRRGLKPFSGFLEFYTAGTWTLFTDTPDLVPLKDPPPSQRFLGPVLWSPPHSAPLPEKSDGRPLIFLSFGSSNEVPDPRGIVEELASLDVDVWVATAGRFTVPSTDRVYVREFLPGSQAARLADVVVCSGGSTAAYQALAAGKPVVGVPANNDQHLAMRAIERKGAGLSVRSDRATPRTVRAATERVLSDPRFRRQAEAVAQSFDRFDARKRFVEFVRDVSPSQASPHGSVGPVAPSLPERLRRRAQESPSRPALWGWAERKRGEPPLSYGDLWSHVEGLAGALVEQGLKKGDRVCILAGVDPAWDVLQWAIWLAGGVVTGLDVNDAPEKARAAVRQADPRGWVVQNGNLYDEWKEVIRSAPARFVVVLEAEGRDLSATEAVSFRHLLASSRGRRFAGEGPAPDDPATLIFTSGTTGEPKGIPYTHRQLTHAVRAIVRAYHVLPEGFESLCWLPLSNLFQRIVNLCALERGGLVTFVASPRQAPEAVSAIRPEVVIGVPRFFEKMEAGIKKSVSERPAIHRGLFRTAVATGDIYRRMAMEENPARIFLWPIFILLDRAVLAKVRGRFGGRLRFLVSGAAPLPMSVVRFFDALGLRVLEAYGTSENAIPVAMNRPGASRQGTVGRPLGPNEVELASDREVMVKGPGVFSGYWNPQGPGPRFEGAYYRTGDEGRWESGGFLRLLGRRSDFLKTSTGRRIIPGPIEERFKELPFVDQAVVLGQGRKGAALLVTLESQALGSDKIGLTPEQESLAAKALRAQTAKMPPTMRPLAILALNRAFSVVKGEMTANLKLRRGIIEDRYRTALDDLYARVEASSFGEVPVTFLSPADVRGRDIQSFVPLPRLRSWAPMRAWALFVFFLRSASAYFLYARRLLRRPWEHEHLQRELFETLLVLFRDTVGPLKGPLVKLAQTMSYIDFGLTPLARELLGELQTRSAPLAAARVRSVVRKSLGKDPRELFSEWSDAPLAAASVSQIHLARLKDGTRVAVKVRYPGIERIVKSDLSAVRAFLPWISRATGVQNVKDNFLEARRLLLAECDFRREASIMAKFGSIFAGDPVISIPAVHADYCSESVLTMDYIEGQTYAEFKATGSPADFDRAGEAIARFFNVAAFRHCLFNADPHPGNYLFKDGRVYFLDFGFCKEWSPGFIALWKAQTRAVLDDDLAAFTQASRGMGITSVDGSFDYATLLAAYRGTVQKMIVDGGIFQFTPEFVRDIGRVLLTRQLGGGRALNPPETLAFGRLFWGQHAVLADLGARLDYSSFRDFL